MRRGAFQWPGGLSGDARVFRTPLYDSLRFVGHSEVVLNSANPITPCVDADDAPLDFERDVGLTGDAYCALSTEPWLRFRKIEAFPAGAFVRFSYASSVLDAPVRPLLRFWLRDGLYREYILPAPCEGVGVWIGRVPKERSAVWIGPTNRPGKFSFRAIEVRRASFSEIAGRAARAPKRMFYGISAGLIGLSEDSELNWGWALGAEPCSAYPEWRASRHCAKIGVGNSGHDASNGVRIHVLIDARDGTASEIDETCHALVRQSYANWRAHFIGAPRNGEGAALQARWEGEPNFERLLSGAGCFDDGELIGRIVAGDSLEEYALACFVEHFERNPERRLAYADETRGEGATLRATFKPGWSPALWRSINYVGRSAFFRTELLSSIGDWIEISAEELVDRIVSSAGPSEVGALHRPLIALRRVSPVREETIEFVHEGPVPSVGIVIPSRDKPHLLESCLDSLLKKSTFRNLRVVVVDNGSVDARALAVLSRFPEIDARVETLSAPGPFNFSALCNLGAKTVAGEYLLFLNNDTQVLTANWIERLFFFAMQPDIGAVGAKLLYPNGVTQHVGLTLGMAGGAGHFGAACPAASSGWTRRNLVPHEVSAVTAACLMVERQKFDAVGGFDAAHLPVEFNDVDLCLRLSEKGWRTICNSQAQLLHHQSASRGAPLRLLRDHEEERRVFHDRWRAAIRDDPYFHPGLSLYADETALP